MEHIDILRAHGLFDAKVPRYTSYPPANRFENGLGDPMQKDWLKTISPDEAVSIYIHIPFCRRLCWFCACRTQGTQTLNPVEAYVDVLLQELEAYDTCLPKGLGIRRLHLGGGTPTLLTADLMTRLLDRVFERFQPVSDFEFSVEIDPTEANPKVLKVLADHNMTRASVGVQDFNNQVQTAIGREQSFEQTADVIGALRQNGVNSLNIDLLYGLPFQTNQSISDTIDRIISLRPDRLALYGYAHVPHVSKRQVMIPDETLPDPESRYKMAQLAKVRLTSHGYTPLGIDHFALPSDSLTRAWTQGTMRRNFQGYTDDPCPTLLGMGASAISQFAQGYVQNAVSTAAYTDRVRTTGLAGHKGIVLSKDDCFLAALINAIMCDGAVNIPEMARRFPDFTNDLEQIHNRLTTKFADLLIKENGVLQIKENFLAAARLIAAEIDQCRSFEHPHSLAI